MKHRAFIGLGSNIEPERYLPVAVSELTSLGEIVSVSEVYQSAAVGESNQSDFLNAAVLWETDLTPLQVCDALREIEHRMGRVRDPHNKNAARTIDLDLVLYDDAVMAVGHRRIPDTEILTQSYLAVPLAELDRDYVHPEARETLGAIADNLLIDGQKLIHRPDVRLR